MTARKTGVVAVAVLGLLLCASFVRTLRGPAAPRPAANAAPSSPVHASAPALRAGAAAAAVADLASAVGSLTEFEVMRRARNPPPPDPSTFVSPTACVRSYLPGVDLPEGSFDFLCEEADAWALERRLYEGVLHRPGEGVRGVTRLGHYGLAVVATMRSGCCVSPEPVLAVMGGLWCGILRDALREFGPVPNLETVRTFDEIMKCLRGRGQRLPERWDHVPMERSLGAFEAFRENARLRGSE